MNCQSLLSNIGFECTNLDADTLRIWSPFSYGSDGELIGVYVEKRGDRYHVDLSLSRPLFENAVDRKSTRLNSSHRP